MTLYSPMRAQREFNCSTARVKVFSGGNRVGKTTTGCWEVGCHITGQYPDWYPFENRLPAGNRGRIIVGDFVKGVKGVLEPKMLEWWPDFGNRDKWDIRRNSQTGALEKLTFKRTGSTVDILTYSQDTSKTEGWAGHYVWADEPPPHDKFIALKRGLVDFDGQFLMTMTLLTEPWIIQELYEPSKCPGSGIDFFFASMDDNCVDNGGYLTRESIEEFCKYLDDDELESRRYGRFGALEGRIYKTYDDSKHVINLSVEHIQEMAKKCICYFVMDPADSKAQTMAWFLVTPPSPKSFHIVAWESSFGGHTTVSETAEHILRVNQELKLEPWIYIIDPSFGNKYSAQTGTSLKSDYARLGICFVDGINDLEAGHAKVKEALHFKPDDPESIPTLLIASHCPMMRKSMLRYAWANDGSGRPVLVGNAKPAEKWKDFPDLIRYFEMAMPTWRDREAEERARQRVVIPFRGSGAQINLSSFAG